MDEIKNPFGSVQTNPQANAWWVPLFIFFKKCFSETPYWTPFFRNLSTIKSQAKNIKATL